MTLSIVLLIACLLPTARAQSSPPPVATPWYNDCQRSSRSDEKTRPPKFICLYEAKVTRLDDCSADVAERIVLPHRYQNNFFNRSNWIGALQDFKTEHISVRYNGNKPLKPSVQPIATGMKCGQGKIIMKFNHTKPGFVPLRDENPVQIELNYVVGNGVMRAGKTCPSIGSHEIGGSWSSVMRWTSGVRLNTTYDFINVTFNSSSGSDVRLVGSSQYKLINKSDGEEDEFERVSRNEINEADIEQSEDIGPEAWRVWRNVSHEIEVFAAVNGGTSCEQNMWCIHRRFLDDSVRYTPAFFAICGVLVLMVIGLIVFCVCVRCCARSKTVKRQRQQQQHRHHE